MKRYVLHCETPVVSRNDGDVHYVSAIDLAGLYGVPLSECIVITKDSIMEKSRLIGLRSLKHLYVKSSGDYPAFKKEK